jgi:hypothetical protein
MHGSIKELAKFGLFKSQMQDLFPDYRNSYSNWIFKLQIVLVIVSEFCSNVMYTVKYIYSLMP